MKKKYKPATELEEELQKLVWPTETVSILQMLCELHLITHFHCEK